MSVTRFTLDSPPFRGRTGAGVRVAVVDSGIAAGHPHVGQVSLAVRVAGGIHHDDVGDRLGHGTAVAAAIREKAPACELLSVKVFDRTLTTSAEQLADAITWSADQGARLINLSLGTSNPEHEKLLAAAVAHAVLRGTMVVSAAAGEGVRWLPGTLPGVVGVLVDWDCDRGALEVRVDDAGVAIWRASAYPRPIPGVPRERNLWGVSFAVANTTGFLGRLLETEPQIRELGNLVRALSV